MSRPRKRWRTQAMGGGASDPFTSKKAAYEFVAALRSSWQAGASDASVIDVWVDEGSGWRCYERINFVDEARERAEAHAVEMPAALIGLAGMYGRYRLEQGGDDADER